MRRLTLLWRAIRHWEFWPYWFFYAPVYAQIVWRGTLSGRLAGFACANPGLPFGGLLEYSKWQLLSELPEKYVPSTIVLPLSVPADEAILEMGRAGLTYPVYAKPDRGERGLMVERISTDDELRAYLDQARRFTAVLNESGFDSSREKLLIQEAADGEMEFGVLYSRFPGESSGRITSIVRKDLLSVTGDGERTLGRLIDEGERTRLHRSQLREEFADRLDDVPPDGSVVPLVHVGNHVRGATFLDATYLASGRMVSVFDELTHNLRGFCTGRVDLRCPTERALEEGAFQVIEVNAVNSEPAHIYDPSNSLFRAYRDLLRHWRLVHGIAAANIAAGCEPPSGRSLLAAIGRHARRRRLASSS
jgi:hypothetical protein